MFIFVGAYVRKTHYGAPVIGGKSVDDGSDDDGSNNDGSNDDESNDDGGSSDDDSFEDPGAPTIKEVLEFEGGPGAVYEFVDGLLVSNLRCTICRSLGMDHMHCRVCGEDSGAYYSEKPTRNDVNYYLNLTEKQFERIMDG